MDADLTCRNNNRISLHQDSIVLAIKNVAAWVACLCLGWGASAYAGIPAARPGIVTEPVYECSDPHYREFLEKNYVLFEVGQVHPLELSVDRQWLFALNSPLGCLEIYRVEDARLRLASSVAVGLQPVSVRVRNAQEVWVVNHLSDNVSVVDLSGRPKIKQILQVGDAPFDVAFAAKDTDGQAARAYISCSARGQHHPTFELHNLVSNVVEYQENGESKRDKLGMADLWVYNIHKDVRLEGIINPFMSDLRSLAVADDGKTVYGAGFLSGNQTTSVLSDALGAVSDENLGSVATARIIKKHGSQWKDSEGQDWSNRVLIDLPDVDVIAVDATRQPLPYRMQGRQPVTNTNRQLIKETFSGMGSVLFSLAVDGDRLLLTALESHNEIPLEENLVGRAVTNMLVVQQGQKTERINLDEVSDKKAEGSIPLPGAIHVGKKYVYVAGFGSPRVALFRRASAGLSLAGMMDLRKLSQGNAVNGNSVAGMGPSGIVELSSGAVVVLSRLDNTLHVLKPDESQPDSFTGLQTIAMFTPEPAEIVQGRRFLYDADATGNGKEACGSCHIFGDWDGLAWDLGSKAGKLVRNDKLFIEIKGALVENMANTVRVLPLKLAPDDYTVGSEVPVGRYRLPLCFKGTADELHKQLQGKTFGKNACALYVTRAAANGESKDYHVRALALDAQWLSINFPYFDSLKGPMGTQTLYGLTYGGPMHHQGDRTGSVPTADNHCPAGSSIEDRAFKEFNQPCDGGRGAFVDLLAGRQLGTEEMAMFSNFVMRMHFPPNPHRALDNRVPPAWEKLFDQAPIARDITSARALFSSQAPGLVSCEHCHKLDAGRGHFGTGGDRYYSAPNAVSQDLDVPDFRMFYRKLGYHLGDEERNYLAAQPEPPAILDKRQVTGFGFFHNAAFDPVNAVFNPAFFRYPGDKVNVSDKKSVDYDVNERRQMFYYLSLFDTDVFPVGGQQRLVGGVENDLSLRNPRYCDSYGFKGGKFIEDGMTDFDRGTMLTCYPRLQAEGKK